MSHWFLSRKKWLKLINIFCWWLFQIALVHFLFNISGILLWYPIPFTRVPIWLAKRLGNITASYRWFAIVYIVCCFFVLPLFVFSLSLAGWKVLVGVGVPLLSMLLIIIVINMLQKWKPGCLPAVLRSWDFLPLWAHSLAPWDKVVGVITAKCCCCCKCCQVAADDEQHREVEPVEKNQKAPTEAYDNPAMSAEKEVENEMKIELKILKMSRLWKHSTFRQNSNISIIFMYLLLVGYCLWVVLCSLKLPLKD